MALTDAERNAARHPGRAPTAAPRIILVDICKTVALLAMICFHFVTDLELFGLVPSGTTVQGVWYVMARVIAGSFIFLVGVSLVLAYADGIRWRRFWRQTARLALAASIISGATYAAIPELFIYFGILHVIVVAKFAGIAVVRRSVWFAAIAALIVVAVWWHYGLSLPLDPWMAWTGLAAVPRPTLDLIPIFPWLAPMFLGIVFAKKVDIRAWPSPEGRIATALSWPGRHSLAVYLLHQPVLIASLWLALRIA